jgi:hypothetical protein
MMNLSNTHNQGGKMGFFDNLGDRAEHMGRGAVNGMANRGMSQVRNGIGGIFRRGADAVRDAFDGDDDDDDKKQSRGAPQTKNLFQRIITADLDGDGKTEPFGNRDDDDDNKKPSKSSSKKGSSSRNDDDDDKKQSRGGPQKKNLFQRILTADLDGDGKTEMPKPLAEIGEHAKEAARGLGGRLKGAAMGFADGHTHGAASRAIELAQNHEQGQNNNRGGHGGGRHG